MIKNKRGWIRIVEAFMAVIIVLGVVLVINQRAQAPARSGEEITKLERNILDFARQDNLLRSEVLSGNLSGVDKIVSVMTPSGYEYAIRNCSINDVCSFDGQSYINTDIYAEDTLIVANLTYFEPTQSKKLKLFMWAGKWPEGYSKPNYQAG